MNKMKKLLSVVLAVVLAFSALSVLGSAAKTSYQTVDNLTALGAYSPYGQVTRLSTEERTSILFDALDNLLPGLNINMGEVFNVLGLSVTIDLTSVDRLCYSLDTIKSTFENGLATIAMAFVNLGILESLETGKWVEGMTRDGTANYTILSTLLDFLSDNTTLIGKLFTDGLDLGIVSLGDMSSIENIIMDLPSLVKGLVFPMLERWDDTLAEIQTLDANSKGNGGVESTVNTFVKNLFTNDMSITTVKYDADGNMTSEHTKMPFGSAAPGAPTATSPRCYYQRVDNKTLKIWHIVDAKEAEDRANDADDSNDAAAYTYVEQEETYYLEEEANNGVYVWKSTDDWGNVTTLKWYNDDSRFLPSLDQEVDLASSSLADLLYMFIPYVFDEMAPVVLNGSIKKIVGGLFGVRYNYVGQVGSDEVNALEDAQNDFFTQEQGEYLWEWSDYAVINGNHYYRFEDQIFAGDIKSVNNYFSVVNWDYEITGDFMNEFIPTSPSADSTLLMNFNNFLVKVAETVFAKTATFTAYEGSENEKTTTWTLPTLTKGDNSNLVANIKAVAQAFIELAPEYIFGSDYETNPRCYYNLLVSDDNDTVLVGIAAQLVDMIMPSMSLPAADEIVGSNAKVGAILAAVIREFAAYLVPEYNFDALIYTDYGTTTGDPVKSFVAGKDSGYWLDVCMTIGMNVGFEYLRGFADMGEGSTEWNSMVAYSGYGEDGKTYAAGTTQAALVTEWEGMLDYIIDWALDKDLEWSWKFENIVNTTGLTIDMATAQDPWTKLDTILFNENTGLLGVINQIINVTATDCETKTEQALRYNLILGIVDLEWEKVTDMLKVPNGFVRNTNVLDQLAAVLKSIINGIFAKVGGGSYALLPAAITDFDTLANQDNLVTTVKSLVGVLYTAGVTNKTCEVVIPFLNFILGWKMDPQVVADPQIWTSFRDGNDYAFQWSGQTNYPAIDSTSTMLKILNSSSGMLETHRGSSVTDHAYDIQIRGITSDASVNTVTFDYGDGHISPYETLDIKIGGTYSGEEAVTATITYDYVGKDGQPVGGTLYMSYTFFLSNQYEDSNVIGTHDGQLDGADYNMSDWNKYVFTEDIYTTVTTYEPTLSGAAKTIGGGDSPYKYTSAPGPEVITWDCGTITGRDDSNAVNMTGYALDYFAYYQNRDGGWAESFGNKGSTSGKLYYAKDGVTAETEFPYGVYDMGWVDVCYNSAPKSWDPDFIYYNDYNVYDIFTANVNNGYTADQVGDVAVYNEYNAAFKDIVKLATYPMMTKQNGNAATDYVDVIMPQIEPAIERFEAAKEAFELAKAEAGAAGSSAALPEYVQDLEAQLALDDGDGELEVNFQDYEFYEYFNYADLRTEARNLVKTYYAPEIMDTYYISGSGIREEELNNVIAAEENSFIAAGITASRMENDPEAIAASVSAHNDWTMPTTTKLHIDDMTSRLAYYKQFLVGNEEGTEHMYFLENEINHVNAQQLVAEDYEAVSWARFADALEYANAVKAGTEEYADNNSIIYNAKYNLMVAYKQLLLKADSLIEAGGTGDLLANADIANEIFTSLAAGDGAWAVREGVNADKAYAALISALGYKYVGADGNTWNLYADSAIEYIENDRPNRQSNQAKVNAANNALVAAIANFEQAATEPNTLILNENAPFEAIIDLENNVGGEYTGTIYGFDTLGWNDDFIVDGAIADFVTTAYGDEYLEVVVGDAGVETTGTVINVLDAEGSVVESYVYIYFGDIDMDGNIGTSDAGVAEYYEGTYDAEGAGIYNLAQYMAGDLDGDAYPGVSDAIIMENWEGAYSGMQLQSDIAVQNSGIVYEIF